MNDEQNTQKREILNTVTDELTRLFHSQNGSYTTIIRERLTPGETRFLLKYLIDNKRKRDTPYQLFSFFDKLFAKHNDLELVQSLFYVVAYYLNLTVWFTSLSGPNANAVAIEESVLTHFFGDLHELPEQKVIQDHMNFLFAPLLVISKDDSDEIKKADIAKLYPNPFWRVAVGAVLLPETIKIGDHDSRKIAYLMKIFNQVLYGEIESVRFLKLFQVVHFEENSYTQLKIVMNVILIFKNGLVDDATELFDLGLSGKNNYDFMPFFTHFFLETIDTFENKKNLEFPIKILGELVENKSPYAEFLLMAESPSRGSYNLSIFSLLIFTAGEYLKDPAFQVLLIKIFQAMKLQDIAQAFFVLRGVENGVSGDISAFYCLLKESEPRAFLEREEFQEIIIKAIGVRPDLFASSLFALLNPQTNEYENSSVLYSMLLYPEGLALLKNSDFQAVLINAVKDHPKAFADALFALRKPGSKLFTNTSVFYGLFGSFEGCVLLRRKDFRAELIRAAREQPIAFAQALFSRRDRFAGNLENMSALCYVFGAFEGHELLKRENFYKAFINAIAKERVLFAQTLFAKCCTRTGDKEVTSAFYCLLRNYYDGDLLRKADFQVELLRAIDAEPEAFVQALLGSITKASAEMTALGKVSESLSVLLASLVLRSVIVHACQDKREKTRETFFMMPESFRNKYTLFVNEVCPESNSRATVNFPPQADDQESHQFHL